MSVTIGAFSCDLLTAQPFGYNETTVSQGLTARQWSINGLLEPADWLALLSVYDAWRNAKIAENPPEISGVVGTTVSFSGTGPGGQSWSSIACWFNTAPVGAQAGAYISFSVELVDANQQLATINKAQQNESLEDLPNFGTYTLGSATLTLIKPPDTYENVPELALTAGGTHYISGPKAAFRVKDIEGTTDAAGWAEVKAWYENIVTTTPSASTYYPTGAPTATAENKIVNGVKTVVYTVSVTLAQVA